MKNIVISVALLFCTSVSRAQAIEPIMASAVTFGSVVDSSCDENTFRNESAALAAWTAKFAVSTVIGFASSLLENATEASTVIRKATAPGYFHIWSPVRKSWFPYMGCIRFWYGERGIADIDDSGAGVYGPSPKGQEASWRSITTRWARLGFVSQPYLYGEVRLSYRQFDNAMTLQPVVLFARRPPEGRGFLRQVSHLSVAMDLRSLSSEAIVATHALEIPDVSNGAVLIRGVAATTGLASAWAAIPASPQEAAKKDEGSSGPFSALVTFTSSTDGTLFGKTIASTFAAQKDALIEAATPLSRQQRSAYQEAAVNAAFSAVSDVLDSQKAYEDAIGDSEKSKTLLNLNKAKYIANLRLSAAGLQPRYDVAGP